MARSNPFTEDATTFTSTSPAARAGHLHVGHLWAAGYLRQCHSAH
ncbi:hypothetical protein ACIBBD_28560 [Streptomyces sp. NPDC051315]